MNHTLISHAGRAFAALAISCALVAGFTPAASAIGSPATASSVANGKKKVNVGLDLSKNKAKANEEVKLHGKLDVLEGGLLSDEAVSSGSETLILQTQTSAGLWVDYGSYYCKPKGTFSLSLSFSATVSLRLYHPETTLYLSAYSNISLLTIL
ncbi:hypothetical protein SAMN05421504_10997 [Amycolatopsis xylanica]|uniref:Uncharacterized protein n=1 Tax=Amycolatopsis xylanica TaxID=589385 RepID=A0A1H3Q3A8_9PSEU|nr:hypothetical protein [Amycolatopsis xylanica]SDZ08022.1 hypothetical protein SAMN05421504_10997 [Amycolatopsis xylanica]